MILSLDQPQKPVKVTTRVKERTSGALSQSASCDMLSASFRRRAKAEVNAMNVVELRDLVNKYFSDSELRDLCFELSIDYESLGGDNKPAKARELVTYCQRRDRLADLEAACRRLRPNAFKDSPTSAADSTAAPRAEERPAGTVIHQSGGVTINAQNVTITGDVAGRDKKSSSDSDSA
jgi:hypothetical protein